MENLPLFNFDEFFAKFRIPILILLVGGILFGIGVVYVKTGFNFSSEKVEILSNQKSASDAGTFSDNEITAEIAGEVITPGVYKLSNGSRIDELLVVAGGFSKDADRVWTDKYLNRAAKLTDGQKVYIPKVGEQSNVLSAKITAGDQTASTAFSSDSSGLININTASANQLDSLPGIGPTYAQKIIEHRPYSTLEELVSKGAIKQNLFEKIKDKITIY